MTKQQWAEAARQAGLLDDQGNPTLPSAPSSGGGSVDWQTLAIAGGIALLNLGASWLRGYLSNRQTRKTDRLREQGQQSSGAQASQTAEGGGQAQSAGQPAGDASRPQQPKPVV